MVSPNDAEGRYTVADYRVRIFLSVDLSGSTAFKNSGYGEERVEGETPRWVLEFQNFYSHFPSAFKAEYQKQRTVASGSDPCPDVWKALGDELVFCGRVSNARSVATILHSFIETIHKFRKILFEKALPLNVKGAAWLAAFPEPNRAVNLRTRKAKDFLLSTEQLERAADNTPSDFDFLGKAIDTGFRVGSTATPEKFSICVQLGTLLSSVPEGTGLNYTIYFDPPIMLKGVNQGNAYPVLYLDTLKHMPLEGVRSKERTLLGQKAPDREQLSDYLRSYCQMVGTDQICLPIDAEAKSPSPPESYLKHREQLQEHLGKERDREYTDGEPEDIPNDENDRLAELQEPESLTPIE